jgi:hypothetical protein
VKAWHKNRAGAVDEDVAANNVAGHRV